MFGPQHADKLLAWLKVIPELHHTELSLKSACRAGYFTLHATTIINSYK